MLGAITLLLVCQLAGEAIQMATGVPVPGPVIGMALLFAGLVLRRRLRTDDASPVTGSIGKAATIRWSIPF